MKKVIVNFERYADDFKKGQCENCPFGIFMQDHYTGEIMLDCRFDWDSSECQAIVIDDGSRDDPKITYSTCFNAIMQLTKPNEFQIRMMLDALKEDQSDDYYVKMFDIIKSRFGISKKIDKMYELNQ